ncbi:MAG: oxygen-independent coproporphyrinogen III oxidase [Alphaproteobacteria bacterium]|nr:MAG: oxygen-independent coproporphyrinogen III oxidase [Alphaproteobacteria bacterium]
MADVLLRHNQQVPRYTSYPTAPHFSAAVDSDTMQGWIRALPEGGALSLYIHIPFCRQMCWYCGCNTRASRHYEPLENYLKTLFLEIDQVAHWIGRPEQVSHIHFGGGSPSMLRPEDFTRLMAWLRRHFAVRADAEIAIELDPREVTEAKVAAYAAAGVNRASLGVQDFHEEVQRAIGRRQPFHVIYDAVRTLRDYGIRRINMDLLYGLPHQDRLVIEENVDFAAALAPDRISLFGYAHVPWMKKHMRLINEAALPDGTARLEQFDVAKRRLGRRGYVPIGLDHFVLPDDSMATALRDGHLHRNFQGYTTDAATCLIGFGASAISALPDGYAQNAPDVRSYDAAVRAGRAATVKGKRLSADDRLRRAIIERLMCYFDIDLKVFSAVHGLPRDYFANAIARLQPLVTDGLVEIADGLVTVNPAAPQAVRLVCAAFDSYLQPTAGRHAQVA